MGGWTDIGHEIQTLSRHCPDFGQTLSNRAQSTKIVQCLSNNEQPCPVSVKWQSSSCPIKVLWTDTGLESPEFVQTLSDEEVIYHSGQSLDKLWTWTKIRFCAFDKYNLHLIGHTLDKVWTQTYFGQSLDSDKQWTNF